MGEALRMRMSEDCNSRNFGKIYNLHSSRFNGVCRKKTEGSKIFQIGLWQENKGGKVFTVLCPPLFWMRGEIQLSWLEERRPC